MASMLLGNGSYHRAEVLGDGSYGSVRTVYDDDGEVFACKIMETDEDCSLGLGVTLPPSPAAPPSS